MRLCMYTFKYMCIVCVHTYIRDISVHTVCSCFMCVAMYVYIYVCMYVCMCLCVQAEWDILQLESESEP